MTELTKKGGDKSKAKEKPVTEDPKAKKETLETEEEVEGDETGKAKKPAEKTYTKAELDKYSDKAVKQALKDAEEKADMTEAEKLRADNEELNKKLRMRDARDEIIEQLKKAGARAPELLFKTIVGDLEFDEKTGKVTNTSDLIEDLKSSFADQFGEEKPTDTIDAGKGQKGTEGALTAEKLKNMTPQDIMKLDQEAVNKVLIDAK